MAVDGRIARLRIDISDEPGMLAAITASIGKCGGNIVEIYHQRLFYDVPAKLAKIDAVIEAEKAQYLQIFSRHNLDVLALKKPGLMENRFNGASEKVMEGLEDDTEILYNLSNPSTD